MINVNDDGDAIGGFAPGFYMCTCKRCQKEFLGGKRSYQCRPCAVVEAFEKSRAPKSIRPPQITRNRDEIGLTWFENGDRVDAIINTFFGTIGWVGKFGEDLVQGANDVPLPSGLMDMLKKLHGI